MYYINNSQEVSFDALTNVPTEPTKNISPSNRWKPVPHHHLVDLVKNSVTAHGFNIHQERYGLDKHNNLFGIIKLEREDHNNGTFRNVIGIRNSHNQDFSAQLVGGANVMVCDNLMFDGEFSDRRKHTTNVLRDLPEIVYSLTNDVVSSYADQTCRYNGYQYTSLDKSDVADIMHDATRNDFAISGGQYNKVLNEYENPQHEEFEPGNAWSLFNAFTEVYKNYNGATVRRSINLHSIFDKRCELAIDHELTSYAPDQLSLDFKGTPVSDTELEQMLAH